MTYNSLSPSDVDEFLNRFNHFNDGLIRQMVVLFWRSAGRSALIECSTIDTFTDAWCNIIFRVNNLSAVKVIEGRTSNVVLSDGVHVAWFNGHCYLDFAPYTSAPDGLEDVERSQFYLAGHSVDWAVKPYAESPEVVAIPND